MGHASLAFDIQVKNPQLSYRKNRGFLEGKKNKNTTTFSAYTETAGRLFE